MAMAAITMLLLLLHSAYIQDPYSILISLAHDKFQPAVLLPQAALKWHCIVSCHLF